MGTDADRAALVEVLRAAADTLATLGKHLATAAALLEQEGRGPEGVPAPPGRPPAALTVRAVAEALGVHDNTVRRAIAEGRLPCIRIGRAIRIRVADVERFLEDLASAQPPARAARGSVSAPPRARPVRGEFARRARGLPPL